MNVYEVRPRKERVRANSLLYSRKFGVLWLSFGPVGSGFCGVIGA